MSSFELDKEMEIELKATFIGKGTDAPVTGDEYTLRLYDQDFFGQDYLGEAKLNESGEGKIVFGEKAFRKGLNRDTLPDFYFVLYKDDIPVFQSKPIEGLNPDRYEQYKLGEGDVIDLGVFLV
jgi:hypothetical protein